MKNLLLLFSLLFALYSCNPCGTCLNDGVCVDGTCECPDGFSGDQCEIDELGRFVKIWQGSRSCYETNPDEPETYNDLAVWVQASTDENIDLTIDFSLTNFGLQIFLSDFRANAFLNDTGGFTIPESFIETPSGDLVIIKGDGFLDDENNLIINNEIIIQNLSSLKCTYTLM